MDNHEIGRRLDEIAQRLETVSPSGLDQPARYTQLDRIEHMLRWLCDQAVAPPPPPVLPVGAQPRANPTWPWEPDTVSQGFLSGKYERRDGTVYGPGSTEADAHVNSAIRGGDDAQAKVDPQSGEPRSGGAARSDGARPDHSRPARAPARPR